MSRHFPPSGAELKVLDVGCGPGNSALQLLTFRPDLRIIGVDFAANILKDAQTAARKAQQTKRTAWIQGDALKLPLPDNSVDTITAHSVLYMVRDTTQFLAEAMRVLRPGGRLILLNPTDIPYPFGLVTKAWRSKSHLSIMVWHAVSQMHRRYTLEQLAQTLNNAGFARVLSERVVEGYGILSRGEKPYTHLSTIDRIAGTVVLDDSTGSGEQPQIIEAATLETTSRGKFVFLLVRQTPDKPSWSLNPNDVIRWQAAMINDSERNGAPHLIAFTSLSKAVAFMQAAVTANALIGINKVAKYDKAVASGWAADLLLNPSFEVLRNSPQFKFNGIMMDVDPNRAVVGEE
jgi:ubiquinone/menaquinone biosynthesis C-methylase UbiE